MAAEKSVVVPLGADETFKMLTEPARLRRWQTVTARIDVRAGGDYRWTIVPGHTAGGKVVEVEPGRRLVMTWGWEDSIDMPPGASTVTITLEPTDGGTRVRLVHEGLTGEQEASHLRGLDSLPRAPADGHDRPATPAPTIGRRSPIRSIRSAPPRPRSPSASWRCAASSLPTPRSRRRAPSSP